MTTSLPPEEVSQMCLTLINNAARIYWANEHNQNLMMSRGASDPNLYHIGMSSSLGGLDYALSNAIKHVDDAVAKVIPPKPPEPGTAIDTGETNVRYLKPKNKS